MYRLPRSVLTQLSLVALVIVMLWTSIFLHLSQERSQAERAAWEDGGNLASGFGESIDRTIEAVDQVLLMVRALYRADPKHFDITTLAPGDQVLTDFTLQISLTDKRGMMLGSNAGPSAGVDLSDREHIRVQMNDSADRLFISKPVLGRITGRWSLQFTRKLFDSTGAFAGVLVVSLNPEYLAKFYDSIAIGRGAVLLVGEDGVIRVRAPSGEAAMGKMLDEAARARLYSGPLQGRYRATSTIDGVDRLYSFRRLARYPLTVAVGLATSDVFGAYETDRREYLIVGLGLTLLIALIGALLIRLGQGLLRSQRSLAATLANIGQGIMMIDADGHVAVMNRRAAELLELPPHLAHSHVHFGAILAWQLAESEFGADTDPVADLARSGGLGPGFYERTRRNGVTLEIRTQMLEDGGAVRTYTDITERRRNEMSLAAARDAAEAASRVQSDFLAVMSHEIRTPMNAISGMAGLLIDSELSPNQRRFATTLREAADSLMQIINDILDFSKLEAHRMEFESIPFDLSQVMGSVVDLMQVKALEKHLWLRTEIAPGTPLRLLGDPGRLRQVLLNLVSNALKFTAVGGVTLSVTCADDEPDFALVSIAVRDTGIGIPLAAQQHLFEQFFQVDGSSARGYGGTGLGLAICRRLIERMDGHIDVASEPGAGAVFTVTVRFLRDTSAIADPRLNGLPAHAPLGGRPLRRLRILLAEDNATNRLVAVTRLEMIGHRVDSVAGGAEAVAIVQTVPYDLVLMDVMMPEVDGLTATRMIRALPPPVCDIPIVAMTANVFRHHQDACRAAGMDDMLGKPFTPEQLSRVIDRVIAGTLRQPPEDQSDTPSDAQAYATLIADMGAETAAAVLQAFEEEARARLGTMQRLHAAEHWSELEGEARRLHDAGGSLGLVRLAALAGQIARDPDGEAAASALSRLPDALDDTMAVLAKC
jgi:signal transduction histidine kinase/CheY-like chemotaxis protein